MNKMIFLIMRCFISRSANTLRCAANSRVTVSGSLLVCLDLLTDLCLDLLCAATCKMITFVLQAGQTLLKTSYLLHYCLRRNRSTHGKLYNNRINQNEAKKRL